MIKKFIIYLSLLFNSFSINAQEWFPIGATWYYNQVNFLPGGNSYQHFEVTGEAVIQGKSCKIIAGLCQCGEYGSINYLYQEGDQVFIYDAAHDAFNLLYDFTLVPGDTLHYHSEIAGDTDYLLDSITFLQAGPLNLRVQHIHPVEGWLQLGGIIYERMGNTGCLYPVIGFCDPGTAGLRCYEDSIIGLQKFIPVELPCDYITSSTQQLDEDPSVSIYPNPSEGILNIEADIAIDKLDLLEIQSGKIILQSVCHQSQCRMDIQFIHGGAYILRITLKDGRLITRKVVFF